jgi:site-specific DNA recombinase
LHPGLVSEEDFIAVQGLRAQRVAGMAERRRYLLAGLLRCGICGRRMESCWAANRPAYRCRHGYSSAVTPNPARPKNAYVREDHILPHLPALHARLTATAPLANQRRRTPRGDEIARPVSAENVTGYLRAREITLSYDPRTAILRADTPDAVTAVIGHAS